MAEDRLSRQLESGKMSDSELRQAVAALVAVRIEHVVAQLVRLTTKGDPDALLSSGEQNDWTTPSAIEECGLAAEWLVGLADPGALFLHVDTALHGEWARVSGYLDLACLSQKQRRLLYPYLSRARRPIVQRSLLAAEVRSLNSLLYQAREWGLPAPVFARYRAHINIHGGSQNVIGRIGLAGAIVAVIDALTEIEPGCIVDTYGLRLPSAARTPSDLYAHLFGTPNQDRLLRAVLLRNGIAVVFASDPDIAIFQSLGEPYPSAAAAWSAWEAVRRDVERRRNLVHIYAVGEVKTITDVANVHERLALGGRESRFEVGAPRFLMMGVITQGMAGDAVDRGRPTRRAGLQDRQRFSDVFNLYYLWGYDDARDRHPLHWGQFIDRIAMWCFPAGKP